VLGTIEVGDRDSSGGREVSKRPMSGSGGDNDSAGVL